AFDCPAEFLQPRVLRIRRAPPEALQLAEAAELLRAARRPLIVAGGGVLYSQAGEVLRTFAEAHGVPVAETQAGKSSLPWDHELQMGAIGVTGAPSANEQACAADVVLAVGTRLQDFTTGSHSLFGQATVIGLNVQNLDAAKWGGHALVADAREGLKYLSASLSGWQATPAWTDQSRRRAAAWRHRVQELTTGRPLQQLPYDAEVIGAVRDSALDSPARDIVVGAAGTLPAELHKLWRASLPGGYHMEYGFSCMGYEIAGGLGVKMARPEREVIVMVGDGSYLMMNSELATAVMLNRKLIVVVLDNRGYGCIHRLQRSCGGPRFNNLLSDCVPEGGELPQIDFAAHARSLGAEACHVADVNELREAMVHARAASTTQVIVIDTSPERTTLDGGCWWEVAVPEVSTRAEVRAARQANLDHKQQQQRL
ncbi:MAG TPA: thiamine pyrophosphate-dependent enzyme, partial [Roseateles sp.]|nr:thiamine pyrophosphate-dependent enzyme [Roseateles sp.]